MQSMFTGVLLNWSQSFVMSRSFKSHLRLLVIDDFPLGGNICAKGMGVDSLWSRHILQKRLVVDCGSVCWSRVSGVGEKLDKGMMSRG